MSDLEYDLLDELYFVQSYKDLSSKLQWDDKILRDTIESLLEKDWIRCYATPIRELFGDDIDLATQYHTYFYQASKPGLLAHNSADQNV